MDDIFIIIESTHVFTIIVLIVYEKIGNYLKLRLQILSHIYI